MAFTDYVHRMWLQATFAGLIPGWSPATLYVALYTTPVSDAGGGTEVAGAGYARQAVITSSGWIAEVIGQAEVTFRNTTDIVFPAATADWGIVQAFAILDALAAGNMYCSGSLPTPLAVPSGYQFRFRAGSLEFKLTN